jgi:hypothetical protein
VYYIIQRNKFRIITEEKSSGRAHIPRMFTILTKLHDTIINHLADESSNDYYAYNRINIFIIIIKQTCTHTNVILSAIHIL